MENEIINLAKSKVNSKDNELSKLCKIILKNINDFNCYYCLDTKKTWNARKGAFSSLDGRGSYDIVRCNKCDNGNWVHCSATNSIFSPSGIKIFRTNTVSVSDIFEELKKIYHDKVLEDEAEWYMYEKDNIMKKTTQVNMEVNIRDLANAVYASLKIYAGDIPEIICQIKDLTINLSLTLNDSNDSKEIIKTYKINDKNYYLLYKMEKTLKQVNCFKSCFSGSHFLFTVKYVLISPKNQPAIRKCEEIMSDNIESRIDNFKL